MTLYNYRELFEVLSAPKTQKTDGADTSQLLQLLILKDKEIKDSLKLGESLGISSPYPQSPDLCSAGVVV